MMSRSKLTISKATAATMLLLFFSSGCQHSIHTEKHTFTPPPPPPPQEVKYNEVYDAEIKEIMDLATEDRWEEAQTKADALFQKAPLNPMVQRVHTWVVQARQRRRQQALE